MSPRGTPMSYEEFLRLPDDGRTVWMHGAVVKVPTPTRRPFAGGFARVDVEALR